MAVVPQDDAQGSPATQGRTPLDGVVDPVIGPLGLQTQPSLGSGFTTSTGIQWRAMSPHLPARDKGSDAVSPGQRPLPCSGRPSPHPKRQRVNVGMAVAVGRCLGSEHAQVGQRSTYSTSASARFEQELHSPLWRLLGWDVMRSVLKHSPALLELLLGDLTSSVPLGQDVASVPVAPIIDVAVVTVSRPAMAHHHPAHPEDADHHDDHADHPPTSSAPHQCYHPAVAETIVSGSRSRARSLGERSNISWHLAMARSLSAGPRRRSTARTRTNAAVMPIIFFMFASSSCITSR